MNQQVKKMWVNALRSGEFVRGEGQMKLGDEYCPLGVLCELHRRNAGSNLQWVRDERHPMSEIYMYDGNTGVLPDVVTRWAGLGCDNNPFLDDNSYTVSMWNDSFHRKFEDIADAIEERL
jgi:hypothetical protein